MREGERTVDAVLVGERERGIAETVRLGEELVGRRGPVEERVCGMAVQLGVHWIPAVKHQRRSRDNYGGQAVCMNHS